MGATRQIPEKKYKKRTVRKHGNFFECSKCEYGSNRAFNVNRHYTRIHHRLISPRKCCDKLFKTKGKYYRHCEKRHPENRTSSKISRYYKRDVSKHISEVAALQENKYIFAKSRASHLPSKKMFLCRFLQSTSDAKENVDETLEKFVERADEAPNIALNLEMESEQDTQGEETYQQFLNSFDFESLKLNLMHRCA